MNISFGSDHAGVGYRVEIIKMLKKKGYSTIDHGCPSEDSVDYPDFIHPVAQDIERKEADLGIILCGSGNGAAITANKHQSIRAALCWKVELAELARQHNDANILAIPARYVSLTMAKRMVNAFINANFEGGRHQRRVDKIAID